MLRLEEESKRNRAESSEEDSYVAKLVHDTREKYVSALQNDLDTPTALATVFEFITEGNKILDQGRVGSIAVRSMLEFMSHDFNYIFGAVKMSAGQNLEISPEITSLLKEREAARLAKDWKKSDLLRNKLLEVGIEVQDTPNGQKWRKSVKGI